MTTIGKVKWFNELEGFGYIEQPDGREVYFHYSAIAERGSDKELPQGLSVTFDLIETKMGPEACNVRRAAPPPTPF